MSLGGLVLARANPVPVTVTPPQQCLSLRKWDAAAFLGEAATLTSGVLTTQWNPTLKRYTRAMSVNSSSTTERVQIFIEPRALVDPRYPPNGLKLRLRDVIHLGVAGGPPPWGTIYGRASFGFRANAGNVSSANANQTPFIGFRMDLLAGSNVADPTWKADYVNWDSSVRRSIDTRVTSTALRLLEVELSGVDQTIRWYIDGVLVDSYRPSANDVGGQNLTPAEWSIDTEVNVSSGPAPVPTLTLSMHAGSGQALLCLFDD